MAYTTSPLASPFPAMPPIAGVTPHVVRAGYKDWGRCDLTYVELDEGTAVAGVFTKNLCCSSEVELGRDNVKQGLARALVVNAGNSNAFTGYRGREAVEQIMDQVAAHIGCPREQVFVSSTGVIGVPLPKDKAREGVEKALTAEPCSWEEVANTIATTDTFAKGATATAMIGDTKVTLAAVIKGSGMIAPDMATMLAFIVTDADIHPSVLRALLGLHVRTTFNSVTVDGDTSTNDTCLLFATGASGAPRIGRVGDRRLKSFSAALDKVMLDLAHQLVRDGEGATKFVKVTVDGAASPASARKLAKSIADSPLVKTAIAGQDANWGRVVMAVGKTEEPVDRDRLAIRFGPHQAALDGAPAPTYDEAKMTAYMKNPEIDITVDVGSGRASATVWTCDLTKGYIEINGDYRS